MDPLYEERRAIRVQRVFGIVFVVVAAVGIVIGVLLIIGGAQALTWVTTGALVVLLGLGVERIRSSRKRLAAFELEHGADAGRKPRPSV